MSKTTSLQKLQNRTIISVEEKGYRKKIFSALKLSPSPSAYAVQRGQGHLECILSPWATFRTEIKFLELQIHLGSLARSSSNYRNRLCMAVDGSRTTQNTGWRERSPSPELLPRLGFQHQPRLDLGQT